MKKICVVSGEEFEVSKFETCLRAKFNLVGIDPEVAPWVRFRQIGAFWPHWNLHRRKCDRTEKFIVSIFSKDCVYPIWNRDEWMRNSNPPGAEFDESQEIFPQLWKFFQKSPLPHTFQSHNQNCEYTDDWYHSKNCYLLSKHEDCANVAFCGPDAKSVLDSIGTIGAELVYMTSLPVYSYEARYCFSVSNCKFVTYSAYLQNCKYCFGCCGLMNEQYCVFNKKYSKHEYFFLIKKIEQQMWKTGEWGSFFPGYFAPNPYEESFSGFHFPLSSVEQKGLGFRSVPKIKRDVQKTAELSDIPDGVKDLTSEKIEWLTEQVFWDEKFKRPFKIQLEDITFAQKLGTPLPREYYIGRIQESARWLFFKGKLRNTTCSLSGEKIQTGWPKEYDGRILSEKEYLKVLG